MSDGTRRQMLHFAVSCTVLSLIAMSVNLLMWALE